MNQDFQIRHESKHYRPCNQYKHRFHYSHHRSLLGGRSVKKAAEYLKSWDFFILRHSAKPNRMLLPFLHLNSSCCGGTIEGKEERSHPIFDRKKIVQYQ